MSELVSEVGQDARSQEQFELTSVRDDGCECANPSCEGAINENLTVILGCTWEGTALDWGEVGFCSTECYESFFFDRNNLASLERDLFIEVPEHGAIAADLVVTKEAETFDGQAEAVVAEALGHDISAAHDKLVEDLDEVVSEHGYDPEQVSVEYRPVM